MWTMLNTYFLISCLNVTLTHISCRNKHFPSPLLESVPQLSSVVWVAHKMVLTAKWSVMFFTLLAYKYHSSYIKNMPGLIPKLLCIYWNSLILCLLSCVRSSLKFISMCKGAWSLLAAETSTSTFYKLTQVFHTSRINLSPFTKDFRVWATPIEIVIISCWVLNWT